jgi:nicotinamidase-related amidase
MPAAAPEASSALRSTAVVRKSWPTTDPSAPPVAIIGPSAPKGPPVPIATEKLLKYDYVIIAGQAKSHCVAWTIDDLLTEIMAQDPALARKVYLLEDCTSAVVVPGVIDFTDQADAAFARFKDAGMHVVCSTDPIETWPDFHL